jgi:hypothetical protein
MVIFRPPRLYCVFGLQKGHNIDELPDGCSIGIVGHGRLALPCNLISWVTRKLMPELIRRINDRGHQVPVRDWPIKSPTKHDWNASLGGASRQVRTNDSMAFVAAEAQKGRPTSFDIAIRGRRKPSEEWRPALHPTVRDGSSTKNAAIPRTLELGDGNCGDMLLCQRILILPFLEVFPNDTETKFEKSVAGAGIVRVDEDRDAPVSQAPGLLDGLESQCRR